MIILLKRESRGEGWESSERKLEKKKEGAGGFGFKKKNKKKKIKV